uniref:Uncharacterized protein n=1 Tax=Salix viminalis TaxID=40686 RepID=A0A6N2KE07_SALVM
MRASTSDVFTVRKWTNTREEKMEAKHIVSDGNNTVVTCSDWPNLRGKGEDVRDQYGISQLVHSVQIDGEWPAQTVSLADDGFGPTVADLVALYWERPASPTWWCHVAPGHTSVQAWLNNAKWLLLVFVVF